MAILRLSNLVAASALLAGSGCAGTARGPDAYREDSSQLLQTRSGQLARCYEAALKTDGTLNGTVTVQFVVEKHTGALAHAAVDPARSSAPAALGQCVLTAVSGLALQPPDRNEGQATFVYEFKPRPPTT
ncbi:MAG: hypothetical protein ABIY55_09500 [Kofleriaceae bacterium]